MEQSLFTGNMFVENPRESVTLKLLELLSLSNKVTGYTVNIQKLILVLRILIWLLALKNWKVEV